VPKVDLDHGAIGVKHSADGSRNPGSVHPVERLTEADDSEASEGPGKVLSSQVEPVGVADSFLLGSPLGFSQHFRIWVDSNDVLEEMGEEQSDGPGPATDVEQAPATIETEVFGEGIGQASSVWFAALPVVGGRALEDGFVPDPVFPRVARLRHVFSVAGRHGDRPHPFGGIATPQWGRSRDSTGNRDAAASYGDVGGADLLRHGHHPPLNLIEPALSSRRDMIGPHRTATSSAISAALLLASRNATRRA
jgi:hypothetical protein